MKLIDTVATILISNITDGAMKEKCKELYVLLVLVKFILNEVRPPGL